MSRPSVAVRRSAYGCTCNPVTVRKLNYASLEHSKAALRVQPLTLTYSKSKTTPKYRPAVVSTSPPNPVAFSRPNATEE